MLCVSAVCAHFVFRCLCVVLGSGSGFQLLIVCVSGVRCQLCVYMCMCVCVCMCVGKRSDKFATSVQSIVDMVEWSNFFETFQVKLF